MAIVLVSDSSCDITPALAKTMGVEIVPLFVQFGDDVYQDGVSIDNAKFYELLDTCEQLPRTSQPNPDQFEAVFKKHIDNGDEVIAIMLASKLSGTYNSACIAKKNIGSDKIHVIDSGCVSVAITILLIVADKLRAAGKLAGDIVKEVEQIKKRVDTYAALDSLKYLQKGGRISATKATIGTMLNLKPIVRIYDGVVSNVGIVRGTKRAMTYLADKFAELGCCKNEPLMFANGIANAQMESMIEQISRNFDTAGSVAQDFGATIGAYAGPHSVGLAWVVPEGESNA